MKKVKIGNDIAVTWSLFKDGEPYSLEGLDLTLYLLHAFGRNKIVPDAVRDNNISWTFFGKDQVHTGKYSLEVVINEGQDGMASTDYVDFVQLTQNTPCYEGEDEENVITENIELASSIAFAPVIIKEGGTGLQYAVERTVYPTRIKSDGFEPHEAEISEEYREYNKETYEMVKREEPVFISFMGLFYFVTIIYDDSAEFNHVSHVDNHGLFSYTITITKEGDAILSSKQIQTGGGSATPSDMNSDFSNDF
jgi:hypothetical protein